MSLQRVHSSSTAQAPPSRPFSTNNPFRNASLDSNINTINTNPQYSSWVRHNQSQISFSSDEESDLMLPPTIPGSYNQQRRSSSASIERSQPSMASNGSYSHGANDNMTFSRRPSNNPFQDALSPSSTSSSMGSPPNYPRHSSSSNEIYTSDEKSRLRRERERQREIEREALAIDESDLPPSYEEAAGPRAQTSEYPREKATVNSSSSRSADERRTHREWPGESQRRDPAPRSTRVAATSRSERPRHDSSSSSPQIPPREYRHGSSSSRNVASTDRHSGEHHREHREHKERRSGERHSSSHRHESSRDHSSREHSSREHRSRHHRSKSSKKKREGPPPKNVDTIDKLDVTGLFGGAFHHDGPFDACTPHRNKDTKSAPVLAFPADGPNNSIRGSGHIDSKSATLNYIQGRDEAEDFFGPVPIPSNIIKNKFERYNNSQSTIDAIKQNKNITHLDTNAVATPIHGSTTLGLGSSTFLDGAPVPQKVALEEAKLELTRKKSMKQKLTSPPTRPRNMSMSTNSSDEQIRFVGDIRDKERDSNGNGNSLLKRVKSLKVSSRSKN